jgi:predicted dehydrogenase
MSKIKVGIIGCGTIANSAHIPSYLGCPDAEIKYFCDIIPEKAQEAVKKYGCGIAVTDYKDVLSDPEIVAVSVCTPNALHKKMTMLALSYGCHVACEKPIAFTYADAKEMFEYAKEKNRVLFACQVVRYNQEYQFAKEMMEEGALGEVYFSEFSLIRRRGVPKWGAFHRKDANGGGVLCDLGVHLIDAALWVMGGPKFVSISGTSSSHIARNEKDVLTSLAESGAPAGVFNARPYSPEEFEVEEFAAGNIRLDNGCCINFKTSWAVNLPPEYSMSFAGSKAGLLLPKMELLSTMGRYQTNIQPRLFPEEARFANEAFPGHSYLFENAVDHILTGSPLAVKPEETLNVAAIIDAFYLSAAEKREVRVEEIMK